MIGQLQVWLLLGIAFVLFALEVWAFVHAVTRRPEAFTYADKRTKVFWVAITGVAALIGFLGLPPGMVIQPVGIFGLAAIIAAAVYLADVRPAVNQYRPRGGRGNQGYGGHDDLPGRW